MGRELADFARRNKMLVDEPQPGDVFVLYFLELKRYAHTGIIVSVDQCLASADDPAYVCTTVEATRITTARARAV